MGWAFVSQAALRAFDRDEHLTAVIDARDRENVDQALLDLGEAGRRVSVVPVPVPSVLLRKYGDSRSRETYMGWRWAAGRLIKSKARAGELDLVHQVTFATASLPHVLPSIPGVRTVWGPVTIPAAAVAAKEGSPPLHERLGVWGLQQLSHVNARHADRLIATNEFTQEAFGPRRSFLEPNIVVDLYGVITPEVDDELLSISGLLINRKRPWIALQALRDPILANYRLLVIGDGPLRGGLESFVRQERLGKRVEFVGRLERHDALSQVARSRVLLHPAIREGSPWVVGEAAALGVPAVAYGRSGADSTVRLSANGGEVVENRTVDPIKTFVQGVATVLSRPRPQPSNRWNAERIPALLDEWWS